MKKYLAIAVLLFCFVQSQAQTKELYLGFTFSPQALTTFQGDPPFQLNTALYLGPTLVSGDWGVNPFYNFGANSLGVFLMYSFNPELGTYLVLDQNLTSNFGVYGVGFTTPLVEDYVQGFVEVGGNWGDNPEPSFMTGLYITFGKKLKEW